LFALDHAAALSKMTVAECWQSSERLASIFEHAVRHYNPDLIVLHGDDYIEAESLGVTLDWDNGGQPIPTAFPTLKQVSSQGLTGSGRIDMLLEAAKYLQQIFPSKPLFFTLRDPFSLAALTMGLEQFLTQLIENRQEVSDWIGLTERHQQHLVTKIRAADFELIVGSPFACCGIINRDQFEQFVFPSLKRILDRVSAEGGFRAFHWCGMLNDYNVLFPELRLDLLSFERLPDAIWSEMPGTLPMGGISASGLASTDPEVTKRALLEATASLPRPFILSPSCFVPAALKPDVLNRLFAEFDDFE